MPAVILLYAALLPSEIRFTIADQTFYPPRIAFVLALPIILSRIARGQLRLTVWDGLVFLSGFWMVLSFVMVYGVEGGLIRGSALAFDLLLAYLIGRLSFRNLDDFRRFLVLVAPGLLLAGSTMLMEVVFGQPIVRPAAASLFGPLPVYEGGQAVGAREAILEERLGILRASGPFSHPILGGLFLAGFLAPYFMSGIRKWPRQFGILASLFAILSVSSAAVLALILCVGLMIVDKLQRIVTFISWRLVLIAGGAALLLAELASENGVVSIIGKYTINPASAAYRRLIWRFGTESVVSHPWIGIGFNDYERPIWMVKASVDNHWLLLAIRFGLLPAIALFTVSVAGVVLLALASSKHSEVDRRTYVGVAIALGILTVLGFTVSFYSGMQSWFYMLTGLAIALSQSHSRAPAAHGASAAIRVPLRPAPLTMGARTSPRTRPRSTPGASI